MTNEEIVLELQQGNKENFGLLYENTINYSLCVARKYLGNRDMDVDDVIQDSYVSALKHINELEDRTKFDKWLGRIIAHRALNWKRDKLSKVYELTIDDDEDPMDFKDDRVDYNPALVVDKKATAEIVNGVLSEIPEAQRDVLIMYYGQQYSIKEISNIVGKPENTIKTWLRRGRQNVEAHKQDFIKQGITLTGISVFVLIRSMFDTDTAMAMQMGRSAFTSVTAAKILAELSSGSGAAAGAATAGSATCAGAATTGTTSAGAGVASGIGTAISGEAGSVAAVGAAAATGIGAAAMGAAGATAVGAVGAATAAAATGAGAAAGAATAGGAAILTKVIIGVAAASVIGVGAYEVSDTFLNEPEDVIETTIASEETEAEDTFTETTVAETVLEETSTEIEERIELDIDTLVSEINENVEYTINDFLGPGYSDYSIYYDNSPDPWGQYDSNLQASTFTLKNGIVVENTVGDSVESEYDDTVTCYHLNPDISDKAENGQNPEDTTIYVLGWRPIGEEDYNDKYEVYLYDGKIIRISINESIVKDYPFGEDIKTVHDEYTDEFGNILELAFPGALGIDHDPSWIYYSSSGKEDISFDGTRYHIRGLYQGKSYTKDEYEDVILDSATQIIKSEKFNPNKSLPNYHDGDTAIQWFERFYNEPDENDSYAYNIYTVKISDNHIDAISNVKVR
ncbi:RNA polymerase sigma factor [Oribacterium sp. FC2011]|uniref:RNA polymerase sigma factor n=1 Tax=Oribacterium sp. FC2011 TaxID=1408311 RepID=UPI0004E18AEE|nr:RNA polymerase sigma factor [Oribacterium sp. FC2011]